MQVYKVRKRFESGGIDAIKGDILIVDHEKEFALSKDMKRHELNAPTLDWLNIHGYLDRIN